MSVASDPEVTAPELASETSNLWKPGFQGLLWTNWLTAINDNVFRWFVIGVGKTFVGPEYYGQILMFGTVCFVLPYILFASPAGWLADRFSKRKVIVGCKIAEIIIMGLGVVALLCQSLFLLMAAVFLMGAQSALFSPAKVGTIPELLGENEISKGNGIFNLATLTAVVIGMGVGGKLADVAGRHGQENVWLTALVLIGIATAGTAVSLLIQRIPAARPSAKFPVNFAGENVADISSLFKSGPLFRVALGVIFFWAIASFAQLNIDIFAEQSGGITESERTPLLVSLLLGVGLGSVLAGLASGDGIELGLVPWGAIGIAIFSVLLFFTPADFLNGQSTWNVVIACSLLAGLGISAGFFDVPLSSYLQHRSPVATRGAILSATNCLMFTGIAMMAFLIMLTGWPTYQGSLANLPKNLQANDLNVAQQTQVDSLTKRLDAEWSSIGKTEADLKSAPKLSDLLSQTAPDSVTRIAAINSLVTADVKQRANRNQAVSLKTYEADFPADSDRRHVKKVILQAGKLPLLTARQNFLLMALMTLPIIGYSIYRLGQPMVRLAVGSLLSLLYRNKTFGAENLPKDSGAILASNHGSWLDGVIILVLVPGIPRTVAWAGNFSGKLTGALARFCGLILMTGGPKSIRDGLKTARNAVKNGEHLGLFPEGGISRSRQVRTFKPGVTKMNNPKDPVPVIPMYFDELWGSIFSYQGGRSMTKLPTSFRRGLSVHIGKPVKDPMNVFEIQQAVTRLGAQAVSHRVGKFNSPAARFITSCKRRKFKTKIADSTQQQETGGSLLTRALVLRRLLRKYVLDASEERVGVLIPPSVGGAIVNLALAVDKRVVINLNYTLSSDLINYCIKNAGLKRVLTTRKVMDKLGFELECEVVYLEDLKDKVTSADKAICAFHAYAMPSALLHSTLGLNSLKPDDVMTIVYTSGSTGVPKGVMLTQQNIGTNVDGIDAVAQLTPNDCLIGILPFFHSMGYTVTLWTPMACNMSVAYHFNPLDAKIIGKLVEKFKGTVLVATPTFLRSYLRRCTPEQFKSIDIAVAGAERLPPELCQQFEDKFGVRPVEGYGATELSPITAVNVPASRQAPSNFQADAKEGTVGRTICNVAAKIIDLDSDEELGPGQSGMLWITGPNVMKGYLDHPEETAKVIKDGWYKTGDVAMLDEDGFIQITGRISRFSKIGGEMVPHVKIEEVLTKFLDDTPDDDSDNHTFAAVTAVPDEKKGERLIVLHVCDKKSVDEMRQSLIDAGLPNLFIPSADSFLHVDTLPVLGTGKLDLKGIQVLAAELTGGN
ncbi:MFS transporter [Mariniblastus sp.]|nr:MFS transporter [Mariniblastus sp.]